MELGDSGLLGLAQAVADGAPIDWANVESTASGPDERHVLQQLRALAQVSVAAQATPAAWGPLQIRGEIASGAFGVVYRAWDPRLEREVALKLLREDRAAGALAAAVVKEGRLLARIRHPGVVAVHGADVCDGRVGIWMELIDGRTLRDIVAEQGPFAATEAALIGRDLCRALAAVHHLGILHRDVKAQNVMREAGGRTVLMDFGAGEALARDGAGSTLRGTPAYLAPELFEGSPPSARSDIYSLGVLLYFLVSGRLPVVGASLPELRERHASGSRALLRDVRPDLPGEFVHVVDACTAPRPDDRPESAGAVEALLDEALGLRTGPAAATAPPAAGRGRARAAAAVALALAVGLGGWAARSRLWPEPARVPRRDSVAILPFNNPDGSYADDYFSEGIAADLLADLAAVRDLRVIAGASTRRYRDRKTTPAEVGRELGVATVLDTSVRQAEGRVRIVAQLVDTHSGEQIWSGSFESARAEVVGMKSTVANQIAVALKGELSSRDVELLRPGVRYDDEAFNLYLKGRQAWERRSEESVRRSILYFHQALDRDPRLAPAHAGLSDAYTALGVYGSIPREEAYVRAAGAAARALQLDPTLAEAHASLGLVHKNRFEWRAAEDSFKRALELKPGLARAHQWYSIFLTQHGRFAEATAEIKIAMSLDPLSVAPKLQFASLLAMSRRYEDSVAQYRQALALDGGFATAYRHLANVYVQMGRFEQAQELYAEARRKSPIGAGDQELKADSGYLYARWGRRSEAVALARELVRRHDGEREETAGSIAAIYAGLGSRDEAMAWLRQAYEARDPETGYLLVDPRWDTLRTDARFTTLLKALGFAAKE